VATLGIDGQLAALEGALAGGLRLVQLREAGLPRAELTKLAREMHSRCHAAGALLVVNGDEGLAREIAADGLHLPSRELTARSTRPEFEWVGASCHSRGELEKAARLGLDYALLGHVASTPSHEGEPPLGWARFEAMVRLLPLPVFAIGGVDACDLDRAHRAGAHGVASIRAAWRQGPATYVR